MHKSDICRYFFPRMFPMSVGRSQESTRNLTSVKHILLWYVSPFFFILFWPLICTTVGPVHSSLIPGSAVGEKMAKNGVKRHRKNWRPERWTEEKEKGGFPLPRLSRADFFAFLPNCRAWSKAAFFTQINVLSVRNQWIRSPKPLSRLVY